jgi:hypothetical protein
MTNLKSFLKRISLFLSDYQTNFILFLLKQNRIPDFQHPKSFSEKMGFIKLFNSNPLREKICDRLQVRNYISHKTNEIAFPKILWSGQRLDSIVWESLPDRFVLKANHGSGMVKLINKDSDIFEKVLLQTQHCLEGNNEIYGSEWFNYSMDMYFIVEEMIEILIC